MWQTIWQRNVGALDRAIRLTGGAALFVAGLFLLGALEGRGGGLAMAAFGFWFMLTGALGRCPLYVLLGIDTRGRKHAPAH